MPYFVLSAFIAGYYLYSGEFLLSVAIGIVTVFIIILSVTIVMYTASRISKK